MKLRWWLAGALVVALAIAAWWWRQHRPLEVALPVFNRTAGPVQVLFYGAGLQDHVLIRELPPDHALAVKLRLRGNGAIRIQCRTGSAQVDAELIGANAALHRGPQQFEIRPGNQFVLSARR